MPKKTRYTHAVNKKKLGNRYANEPTSDSHSESTSVGRQQQQQQKKRRRRCQYNKKKRRNGPTPSPPPPALRWGPISCSESDLRRFTTFECARQFLPPILFIYFFFTATEFPRFTLHNETLSLGSLFFWHLFWSTFDFDRRFAHWTKKKPAPTVLLSLTGLLPSFTGFFIRCA